MIPWPPCKKFQCISIFLKHVLKWVLEWRQNGGNSTNTIVHPVNKFECIIIEMYSISISYRGLCSLWMYLCHLTLKLISYTYFDSVCEDGATLTLKEVFNPNDFWHQGWSNNPLLQSVHPNNEIHRKWAFCKMKWALVVIWGSIFKYFKFAFISVCFSNVTLSYLCPVPLVLSYRRRLLDQLISFYRYHRLF